MTPEKYDYLYKFILVGDSGVGKSNILTMFTRNEFNTECRSTIGVEFATSIMEIDRAKIKIQLWDTAGQERYRAITTAYYRNAVGIILVYDITKRQTFDNIGHWMTQVKEHAPSNVIIYLIGNKSDLTHLREISSTEGANYAAKNNLKFIETSAQTGANIQNVFYDISKELLSKTISSEKSLDPPPIKLTTTIQQPIKSKKTCC